MRFASLLPLCPYPEACPSAEVPDDEDEDVAISPTPPSTRHSTSAGTSTPVTHTTPSTQPSDTDAPTTAREDSAGAYSTSPFEFSAPGVTHSTLAGGQGRDGHNLMESLVSKFGNISRTLDEKMDRANK